MDSDIDQGQFYQRTAVPVTSISRAFLRAGNGTAPLDILYTDWYTASNGQSLQHSGPGPELFAARGYEGVGVQEIVDAANITKPTLYHYFGSKEGLLTELFVEHFEPFLKELRKAAHYERDLPLTLDRVTAVYFLFARNERGLLPYAALAHVRAAGKPGPENCRRVREGAFRYPRRAFLPPRRITAT